MNKIREFVSNHDNAVDIFLNVLMIIFCFYGISRFIDEGFTSEQLDKTSVVCGALSYMILLSFVDIFVAVFRSFRKPKSDKE